VWTHLIINVSRHFFNPLFCVFNKATLDVAQPRCSKAPPLRRLVRSNIAVRFHPVASSVDGTSFLAVFLVASGAIGNVEETNYEEDNARTIEVPSDGTNHLDYPSRHLLDATDVLEFYYDAREREFREGTSSLGRRKRKRRRRRGVDFFESQERREEIEQQRGEIHDERFEFRDSHGNEESEERRLGGEQQ